MSRWDNPSPDLDAVIARADHDHLPRPIHPSLVPVLIPRGPTERKEAPAGASRVHS